MTAATRNPRAGRHHGPVATRFSRPTHRTSTQMCRAHLDLSEYPSDSRRRVERATGATYRRRRAVVGTILAVLVAVGLVAAHDVLAGSGGVPASAAASQPAHVMTVVALPGDTLWSIADRHRGDVSITRYVDTLVDLNGGASIEAGQQIVLP